MDRSQTWKIGLVIAIIVGSVFLLFDFKAKKVRLNLGLDLKGGMHLIMLVQTEEAVTMQTDIQVNQLKDLLKEQSIKYDTAIRKAFNKIEINGIRIESGETGKTVRDILDGDFREWTYSFVGGQVSMTLRPNVERQMRDSTVQQALETIRNRVDEFGVAEPTIQQESGDKILVELPGVDNPEQVKRLINITAVLEFRAVENGPYGSEQEALKEYSKTQDAQAAAGSGLPEDLEILKTNPGRMGKEDSAYVVKKAAVVTGNDLRKAQRSRDENGWPAVGFTLNNEGERKISRFSAANIGKRMAVVLDRRIESVATIQSELSYDNIIKGRFTVEEVDVMVLVLRSGALPASMRTLEERTIGPSLGSDSIRKGLAACFGGLFLVICFMILYYRAAGINSIIALILNMLILVAVMAYFKATLSLPGIAGIILSIGMAVDANVLIFERIREEMGLGKSPKSAIDAGFKKAFWTIFDSNLTTVISAIFLFQFGTGPIKGYAVTLIIGISASMFTAIWVSRLIFDITYSRKKKIARISI